MRRHTYDREGNEVTAEDVLSGDELEEYRRQHPRTRGHQMRFYPWPDYAAEEWERLVEERNREWWT